MFGYFCLNMQSLAFILIDSVHELWCGLKFLHCAVLEQLVASLYHGPKVPLAYLNLSNYLPSSSTGLLGTGIFSVLDHIKFDIDKCMPTSLLSPVLKIRVDL